MIELPFELLRQWIFENLAAIFGVGLAVCFYSINVFILYQFRFKGDRP